MADKKFADAAMARFNGDGGDSEGPGDQAGAADEPETDADLGKMAGAAMRRSDWPAFCEAIRKICGQ
jgi:hypothetical protein